MIKRILRTAAALTLIAFTGQAAADTISGWHNAIDNTAEFSWYINNDGFLVISIANTSNYSGIVTGFQFELGDGGAIDHLVDVDGTGRDRGWDYTTDVRGCYTSDCMITGRHFWAGSPNLGIAAGTTGGFRFFGDFTNLDSISNVLLRFQRGGGGGKQNDGGWGCRDGCQASEVPEPGTLLMFATGLLGFGLVARRRRMI